MRQRRSIRQRRYVALAALAATATVIPLTVTATTASWNDTEWAYGVVGTSTMECDTTTGFPSQSYGRFLSGALLGQDLDAIAALNGMELSIDGAGTPAPVPAPPGSLDWSSGDTYAYTNPLDISALGGIVGLNLTGLEIGLPVGSAGAVNQFARTSTFGDTAGASGLVSNSGAIQVTGSTPSSELPEPATIDLASLLPSGLGIENIALTIGALASSADLDGCAELYSKIWGDGSVSGIARDYGIASLGLDLDSSLVSALVSDVNDGVTDIDTAVSSLVGVPGLISDTIIATLVAELPLGLGATGTSGTVTISGLDLAGAVSTLLTTPLASTAVTIDLQAGTIDVDLEAIIGALNAQSPNTELVVNSAVVNEILSQVGALLDAWSTQVIAALTAELRAATLEVNLSTSVELLSGTSAGLDILNITISLNAPIGDVLDGTAVFTIDAEAAGLVSVLNAALALLGLPTVGDLITLVEGLSSVLVTAVANTITTTAVAAITTLGATLADATDDVVVALDAVVGQLPNVLSLMVNVQPDQSGAPPGSSFTAATATSTPEYKVTALRIGLADYLTPASIAYVMFGTSSAGPVTAP